MATNYKRAAKEASDHYDAARRSSEEHLKELSRMRESAIEAAKDTADRTAYRKRQNRLKMVE